MCAFIGGVASSEVLKATTGKGTPLQQQLMFDAFECLTAYPVGALVVPPQRESRYVGQELVFGKEFQVCTQISSSPLHLINSCFTNIVSLV